MIAVACWALGVATGGALTTWAMSAATLLRATRTDGGQ